MSLSRAHTHTHVHYMLMQTAHLQKDFMLICGNMFWAQFLRLLIGYFKRRKFQLCRTQNYIATTMSESRALEKNALLRVKYLERETNW